MTTAQPPSPNADALKQVEILSDQLDTAMDASEASTKEVRHARRTAEHVKRAVRLQSKRDATQRKRARSTVTVDGKSHAAVELGRKGGAARAKTLTRAQRSALAMKAANTRWKRH